MRLDGIEISENELEYAEHLNEDLRDGHHTFWSLVDSQRAPYYPPSSYEQIRDAGCLALRSDRDRCHRSPITGMPWCDFHIGDAARALRAFVDGELKRQADIQRRRRIEMRLGAAFDAGAILDAKATLREARESVYFFLVPNRAVKIGYSSWPENRAKALRNGGGGAMCPKGLDTSTGFLYAVIGGGRATEGNLHRQLSAHRIVGEWFRLTEAVEMAMEMARIEQERSSEAAA